MWIVAVDVDVVVHKDVAEDVEGEEDRETDCFPHRPTPTLPQTYRAGDRLEEGGVGVVGGRGELRRVRRVRGEGRKAPSGDPGRRRRRRRPRKRRPARSASVPPREVRGARRQPIHHRPLPIRDDLLGASSWHNDTLNVRTYVRRILLPISLHLAQRS
uniref:Uncharacterized protein n=1 Tax=Ananas comosus var. bracteatus TaxID=296719 RepID=A0A6V7NF40_ANACO|nr:unnamed protein product [Ananas comosus var. bracteatus]